MAEFLAEHVRIAAPILEWGGLFLLLFVILSPFLLIRLPYFKPTRWWHVVGVYLLSFAVLAISISLLFSEKIDDLIKENLFRSSNLNANYKFYAVYDAVLLRSWLWLLVLYPLSVFYSTKNLYEKLGWKWFLISATASLLLGGVLVTFTIYAVLYTLGQIGMDHF